MFRYSLCAVSIPVRRTMCPASSYRSKYAVIRRDSVSERRRTAVAPLLPARRFSRYRSGRSQNRPPRGHAEARALHRAFRAVRQEEYREERRKQDTSMHDCRCAALSSSASEADKAGCSTEQSGGDIHPDADSHAQRQRHSSQQRRSFHAP